MRMMGTYAVALALLAAACDGGGPTGVGAGAAGSYRGEHRISITSGGTTITLLCNGGITIGALQSGGGFAGTLTLDACQGESGGTTIIAGTVTGTTLTFTFQDQSSFETLLRDRLGCDVTRIDQSFAGTAGGGTVDATLTATLQCPTEGTVQVAWRIVMSRT